MILRKMITAVAIVMIVAGSMVNVRAEEGEAPAASADLSVLSNYVWRGYVLSDDSLVIQPSVTVGYKGFGLNLWGNLDSDFVGTDEAEWTETDMTLSYERAFGPVSMGVGYIYYALDSASDTEEVYLSAGLDVLLSPTLTIYRDINEFPGWYLNLGISHSFPLPHDITLDLAGSVGYYYSDDDDFVEVGTTKKYRNLHNGLISAGLTIPVDKYITVSPVVSYSFPLSSKADDLLEETSYSNDSSCLFGGVTLSMAF
jgi:hypothetical protein